MGDYSGGLATSFLDAFKSMAELDLAKRQERQRAAEAAVNAELKRQDLKLQGEQQEAQAQHQDEVLAESKRFHDEEVKKWTNEDTVRRMRIQFNREALGVKGRQAYDKFRTQQILATMHRENLPEADAIRAVDYLMADDPSIWQRFMKEDTGPDGVQSIAAGPRGPRNWIDPYVSMFRQDAVLPSVPPKPGSLGDTQHAPSNTNPADPLITGNTPRMQMAMDDFTSRMKLRGYNIAIASARSEILRQTLASSIAMAASDAEYKANRAQREKYRLTVLDPLDADLKRVGIDKAKLQEKLIQGQIKRLDLLNVATKINNEALQKGGAGIAMASKARVWWQTAYKSEEVNMRNADTHIARIDTDIRKSQHNLRFLEAAVRRGPTQIELERNPSIKEDRAAEINALRIHLLDLNTAKSGYVSSKEASRQQAANYKAALDAIAPIGRVQYGPNGQPLPNQGAPPAQGKPGTTPIKNLVPGPGTKPPPVKTPTAPKASAKPAAPRQGSSAYYDSLSTDELLRRAMKGKR